MTAIQCILLEPTDLWEVSMRRYVYNSPAASKCPVSHYHDSFVLLGRVNEEAMEALRVIEKDRTDPGWPKVCGCGHVYTEDDAYQIFSEMLFREKESGELITLSNAPVGAMWFSPWLAEYPAYRGPDGKCLTVRVPASGKGQDWMADARALNCDSPCSHCGQPYYAHKGGVCSGAEDQPYHDSKPHKCWVRHGEAPNITVDKNGVTCGAGGGSIVTDTWHGFLRNGQLVL